MRRLRPLAAGILRLAVCLVLTNAALAGHAEGPGGPAKAFRESMAALMGTLPIAVGLGAGGEARQPLGLAVVGGLGVSQLLALSITPVYYLHIDRLTARPTGRKDAVAQAGA